MSDMQVSFSAFASARAAALLRFAYLLTGDHHHAEDLLQTVLAEVYLRWDRMHFPGPEAYVRRALINTYISWSRRSSWFERPVARVPDRPARIDDRAEDHEDLWRHLRDLPARQRAVVVLRFYEDLSVHETAQILGISSGSVKSHTSRALDALRVQLSESSPARLTSDANHASEVS